MSSASGKYLSLVKQYFKNCASATSFQRCTANCRLISVDEGRVQVEMEVGEEHTNPFGTLHGGFTATIVDIVTTSACIATKRESGGVSVNLTVNYLAPANIGDTILVDAQVTRLGRTVAFTTAEIYRKRDNTRIASAMHTKAFPRIPGATTAGGAKL